MSRHLQVEALIRALPGLRDSDDYYGDLISRYDVLAILSETYASAEGYEIRDSFGLHVATFTYEAAASLFALEHEGTTVHSVGSLLMKKG